MCQSCRQDKSPKHRLPVGLALGLLILGLALSSHLFVVHSRYWWLPLMLVLVAAHATIIGGLVWLGSRLRHRHRHPGTRMDQASAEHSHVLHNPRAYDWLAKIVTLGGEAKFRQRVVDLAELKPDQAVLDVGCGTGTLLIEAARRVGASNSVHGVDRSADMLAHARRKAEAQGINAEFHEASSDHLPFPAASFDVVFSTLMLHHLPAPMQFATIAEMRRVLRPGGRIVIVDMQRPGKVSAAFSHMGLIHLFRPRATMPDWEKIEELLVQPGIKPAGRRAIWGETVCAFVAQTAAPA